MRVLRPHLAPRRHPGGPREDERVGRPAAVGLALPAPERRVPGPRPAPGVVVVGPRAAQLVDLREVLLEALRHLVEEEHLVEGSGDAALGRGAVVGDHHDQRVVELADLLERVEDAAEVVVGMGDEAGVDLHHPGVEAPLVVGQRVPLRDIGIARRQHGVRRQQAELLLAREYRLSVGVPAGVELALVAVGPLLRHVVGSVRRAGREVHEERLLGGIHVRVEDLLDRVVGQVLAEVVALLRRPRLRDRRVVLGQVGIPLVGLAAEEAVEALEPAAERPAVERARRGVVLRRRQVPLAEAERVVAVLEQHLGQHRRSRTACARRSRGSPSPAP